MAKQGHKDRLSAIDASFLHQEKQSSHMHVGALAIFDGPPPARDEFCAHLDARLRPRAALPPEARRSRRFEMGRPFWVDDPSFNLDYHVRHTALPKPGSNDQLRQLAGRIFSQRLDRSKPLWEIWLVQGLEDGRFALISKTHHALVDGVSGVDIATVLFDLGPVPAEAPERGALGARAEPSDAELLAEGVKGLVRTPVRSRRPRARRARAPERRRSSSSARRPRASARWSGRGSTRRPTCRSTCRSGPHRRVRWVREPARRLQGGQERAGRHRQRRGADGRRGRARALAARPRRAHRGRRAARARARCRSAPRRSRGRSATASRRCAARCPCTWTTRSSGCAIVREGWAS